MDLTVLAQEAAALVAAVGAPIAIMLARRVVTVAEQKLHLQISAATEAQIETGVQSGAGMLLGRLAAGKADLSHVSLGNQHVDDAVTLAMTVAGTAGAAAGVTRDTLAGMIVGAVGRALSEDPTVPTVPVAASTTPAVAAAPQAAA